MSARLSAWAAFCSTSSTVVPCGLISAMIEKICWISFGASPIDGSSSSSSRGRAISARPDREHLLLAAGHRAGDLAGALLEPREQRVDPVEVLA